MCGVLWGIADRLVGSGWSGMTSFTGMEIGWLSARGMGLNEAYVFQPSMGSEREKAEAHRALETWCGTGMTSLLLHPTGQGDSRDQPGCWVGKMAAPWLQEHWEIQL